MDAGSLNLGQNGSWSANGNIVLAPFDTDLGTLQAVHFDTTTARIGSDWEAWTWWEETATFYISLNGNIAGLNLNLVPFAPGSLTIPGYLGTYGVGDVWGTTHGSARTTDLSLFSGSEPYLVPVSFWGDIDATITGSDDFLFHSSITVPYTGLFSDHAPFISASVNVWYEYSEFAAGVPETLTPLAGAFVLMPIFVSAVCRFRRK